MTKVSISEAIRMTGISRSHFYNKYINKGLISIQIEDNKKLIDLSELIRVFDNIQLENNISKYSKTNEDTKNTADKDKIIELLELQLRESKQREVEAREREEWLKAQLEKTTHLLEDKTPKPRKKFLGIF